MRFLRWLLDLLFPPTRDDLVVRTLSEDELYGLLSPVPLPLGTALMRYRDRQVGALIREAKFRANELAHAHLAAVLSAYLEEYLYDRFAYEERPVRLIPIPLSKKRFRERGYNQVAEVAKRIALPGVTYEPRLLRRTRDTKAQTSLSKRERLRNMQGAFVAEALDPLYLYIVVDDVSTTGATMAEAVAALKSAGAVHIEAIALSA